LRFGCGDLQKAVTKMGNCMGNSKDSSTKKSMNNGTGGKKTVSLTGKSGATDDDLYAVFKQFDIDGDGFIEEFELRQVMTNMGQAPLEDEIKAMFKAADMNNDGKISFEEFCAISRANPLQLSLKAVFAELDLDGDGYLTRPELKDAFIKMGHDVDEDDIERIILEADKNADSVINFDEFVAMMCHQKMV